MSPPNAPTPVIGDSGGGLGEIMEPQRFTYVACNSCGCAVAIHSADAPYPEHAKQFQKALGEWMAESVKDGLTVNRMPKDEALALFTAECPHESEGQPSLSLV